MGLKIKLNSKQKPIVLVAVIVAIIVLVVGVYYFTTINNDDDDLSNQCNDKNISRAIKYYKEGNNEELVKVGLVVRSDSDYTSNVDCLYLSANSYLEYDLTEEATRDLEKIIVLIDADNESAVAEQMLPSEFTGSVLEKVYTSYDINQEEGEFSANEFPEEPPLPEGQQ